MNAKAKLIDLDDIAESIASLTTMVTEQFDIVNERFEYVDKRFEHMDIRLLGFQNLLYV